MSTYPMKTKKPTKPRTKKTPAVTRENGRVTINAEVIDDIFTDTIANMMALQIVWEKISLKEKLK